MIVHLHVLAVLAILAGTVAQSSTNSSAPSQTVILSTSLSTFLTIGTNRQINTGTSTIVFTSTVTAAPSSSNGTTSGNTTVSSNSTVTASGNSSSSSPTSTAILPTAPTTIAAGGGTAGAPLPGATGGSYGPPDSYTAAASTIARNTLFVGLGALVVSGALMVL